MLELIKSKYPEPVWAHLPSSSTELIQLAEDLINKVFSKLEEQKSCLKERLVAKEQVVKEHKEICTVMEPRLSELEAEARHLRQELAEKDQMLLELGEKISRLQRNTGAADVVSDLHSSEFDKPNGTNKRSRSIC